ncbi:hemolysin family protein [Methylobacterium sp. NEAU 140]|uniref:hemolysin family protein n=1 Tax=Methylobacterium sp. NEAU 140 TaxID=3064945 RepID=UPI0027375FD6|nr:hemolysin family protein [Methylobacterium sp. NEAU 140]MDP4024130.1 hemolysin family protein [Methylobacterium sp. NEAU 140]
MPDAMWSTGLGLTAVVVLVLANGFFVAAEFALVSVRRSRVAELVAKKRLNARALQRATDQLDSYLAATQLGITLASLALGWIGEPALAHLIAPALAWLPGSLGAATAHTIAVAVAFVIITALHIVLGELAPKSLALQRSERTALAVVRPLGLFLFLFRPAILVLNGLGNGLLRLIGLRPGHGEGAQHSTAELNLLVQASQEAGLIKEAQQEAVERIFAIGERRVRDIMTPRHSVEWIDLDDEPAAARAKIRACDHARLVVSRGMIDELVGVVAKQDLLNQILDGDGLDVAASMQPPTVVHEGLSILGLLEIFQRESVRLAAVVDEYGSLEGIVTPTDLLEAIAGEIPEAGESPSVIAGPDGSLSFDGMMPAAEGLARLGIVHESDDFATMAGFVIFHVGRIPVVGDGFDAQGWHVEVTEMAGRRVARVLASPAGEARPAEQGSR